MDSKVWYGLVVVWVISACGSSGSGDHEGDAGAGGSRAGTAGVSGSAGRGGSAGKGGTSGAGGSVGGNAGSAGNAQSGSGGANPPQAGAGGEAGAGSGGESGGSGVGGDAGHPGVGGEAGAGRGGEAGAGAGGDASAGRGGEASGAGAGAGGQANAGAGGEAGASNGTPAVAYVSTLFGLTVASLDPETGAPTLLPGSPVEVDGFLSGLAVSNTGKFLFTIADARIDTFPIAEDGSLPEEPSSSITVDDEDPLLMLALDPLGRFAYAVSPFSKTIYVFTIDAGSGVLTPSGEPLLVGPAPDHRRPAFVAPHPNGEMLYVTQLADGAPPEQDGIRAYNVDAVTGELSELEASPFLAGNVVAGALVFTPGGEFMFSSGGALNAFAIDGETGGLTLVDGSPFSLDVGSDPWAPNLTIDPQGQLLYVSHFLQTQHVSGFSIDPATGALEEVPGSPVDSVAPYSLALGPGGRSLYVGNDDGNISVFDVERPSGRLTPIDESPFPIGGLEPDIAFVSLPGR